MAHGTIRDFSYGLTMVFFDPTGTRRLLFLSSVIVTLGLCIGFIALGIIALVVTPVSEAILYDSTVHENEEFTKTIALTFDDGPDPTYTPLLLDLLKEEQVPATFFLIGEQVARNPSTARLIVESGFEIGNHTFTHSEHVQDSESRLRKELVSTDHVIRNVTGRRTLLFRPPYLEDVNVGEFDGAKIDDEKVTWAENMGYVVVGANLDTQDWNVAPGESEEVLARLTERIKENRPTVIIMHDAAGEGASIEALRTFIPMMKEKGYRFVFVSDYFGLTLEETMPLAPASSVLDSVLAFSARTFALGSPTFNMLVMIVSVLGLTRIWIMVFTRRMLVPKTDKRDDAPRIIGRALITIKTRYGQLRTIWPSMMTSMLPVTVIIPAYNEEANIDATIRSVMSANTPMQLIVVNDGSIDNTGVILTSLLKEYGTRLTVLERENSGSKAGALNHALPYAIGEIVVCIDADTVIGAHTIRRLMAHFDDRRVGAVAGKVYPASTRTILEKFQYLEYMQGQNLEKSVMAIGNAIGVVPGAIGAWRKSAILAAGGYSRDTVVEDQDLTLGLLAAGWKIRFEPAAHAYTETPNSLPAFFRQRSRWVYGTIQCVWKYRTWLFSFEKPSLGWVILPNVIFFNLFVPLLVPIIDGALILGILGFIDIWAVLGPFIVYMLFDLWCAIEGVAHEKISVYRLLPYIVCQRFFYRYLMAAAIIKSVTLAFAGSFVRWGMQHRRGECHDALKGLLREVPLDGAALSAVAISMQTSVPVSVQGVNLDTATTVR